MNARIETAIQTFLTEKISNLSESQIRELIAYHKNYPTLNMTDVIEPKLKKSDVKLIKDDIWRYLVDNVNWDALLSTYESNNTKH